MSQPQHYINSLLDELVLSKFVSDQNLSDLEAIKKKLAGAININLELKNLFKVKNMSQFALGLMWITQRVETNPQLFFPSEEDKAFIMKLYRQAKGIEAPDAAVQPTFTQEQMPVEQQEVAPSTEMQESTTEFQAPMPTETTDFGFQTSEMETVSPMEPQLDTGIPAPKAASEETVTSGENTLSPQFASLFERFVVSVQSGDESRISILQELYSVCKSAQSNTQSEENFKMFTGTMSTFLNYISTNELLDDIRVMNILSNLSDSISRGAEAPPENRFNFAAEAYEVIKDFKALFE